MQKVTGIGGVFFKVRDPAAMAEWYRKHLGIESQDGYKVFDWNDPKGATVWSVFPKDAENFGPSTNNFMINYRVADMTALLDELRSASIVIEKTESHEYGHFAWISDPEGNRIELWQPVA